MKTLYKQILIFLELLSLITHTDSDKLHTHLRWSCSVSEDLELESNKSALRDRKNRRPHALSLSFSIIHLFTSSILIFHFVFYFNPTTLSSLILFSFFPPPSYLTHLFLVLLTFSFVNSSLKIHVRPGRVPLAWQISSVDIQL